MAAVRGDFNLNFQLRLRPALNAFGGDDAAAFVAGPTVERITGVFFQGLEEVGVGAFLEFQRGDAGGLAGEEAGEAFEMLGAAEDDMASVVYHDENVFGGVTASSFKFG